MRQLLIITSLVTSALCFTSVEERLRYLEEKMETSAKQIEMNKAVIANHSIIIENLRSQLIQSDDNPIKIDDRFGLLITGGAPDGRRVWNSTELFIPSTNRSCSLGSLGEGRQGHSSGGRGLMMCGGVDGTEKPVDTCVRWRAGRWVTERRLSRPTVYQTGWNHNGSLILLGGPDWDSTRFSTEVVTGGRARFRLKHETSNACAIPDDRNQQVYITGGEARSSQDIVSLYGYSGWVKDIVSMNIGRSEHACAGYYSQDSLVLLVVGGHSESCRNTEYCNDNGWLTSTEIYTVGEPAWRQVAPLKDSLQKPVAATLDNNIFLTGGRGKGNMKAVLLFRDYEWINFGEMTQPRYYHDVSVIELDQQIRTNCS